MNTWDIHFMSPLTLEEKFPGMTKLDVLVHLMGKDELDTKLTCSESFICQYSPDKDFANQLLHTNNYNELIYYYCSFPIDQLIEGANKYEGNVLFMCDALAENKEKREYIIRNVINEYSLEYLLEVMIRLNAKSLKDVVEIRKIARKRILNWTIRKGDLLVYGCPETWYLVDITIYNTRDLLCLITESNNKELVEYIVSKGIKAEDLLLETATIFISDVNLIVIGFLLDCCKDFSFIQKLTNGLVIDYVNSYFSQI